MSENIQSISQGTYTIGNTSATNFVAGNGIKIDEPSAGTVRIGNDETVLYESNSAVAQGETFNFSETPENFEYIRVYVVHGQNSLTWEQIFEYPGDASRYDVVIFACDQENSLLLDKYFFSRNGKTVTVGLRKRHNLGTSTPTTSTLSSPAFFKKVVGINRINGGNE